MTDGALGLERRALGLVLYRQDRALLDQLCVEWIVLDGGVRSLLRALQHDGALPSWLTATSFVRESLGDPFVIDRLAAAVDGRTDANAHELVASLRWRHERLQAFLRAEAVIEANQRHDWLAAALDRVQP